MNEDNYVHRRDETPPAGPPGKAVSPLVLARWCAGNGWPVHLLAPGRKTPQANCPACRAQHHDPRTCPCPRAGRPCHGFHAGTTDLRNIREGAAAHRAGVCVDRLVLLCTRRRLTGCPRSFRSSQPPGPDPEDRRHAMTRTGHQHPAGCGAVRMPTRSQRSPGGGGETGQGGSRSVRRRPRLGC